MDLRKDSDFLKEVRAGKYTVPQIEIWFQEKEKTLQHLYDHNNTLPYSPEVEPIRQLLLDCIETYGSVSDCVGMTSDEALTTLREITRLTEKFR